MSSAVLALLAASGPVAGPMPDGGVVGAPRTASTCVSDTDPNAIVVCGQQAGPSPRLPMPEDRFAAGEVVRHPGEPPRPDPGPPGDKGHLAETLGKAIAGIRSLLTGEDPGY